MTGEQITSIVLAFIGGGGVVAFFNYLLGRKKITVAQCQTNIQTALKLRDMAIRDYETAEEKLKTARELLDEVQTDLDNSKRYITVLQNILTDNEIEYPDIEDVIKAHNESEGENG